MRVMCVSPGASHSTADVEAGLVYGLQRLGIDPIRFRLDNRIPAAMRRLEAEARRAKKTNPAVERPTMADAVRQAGEPALMRALLHQVDVVLVVSAILFHPDIIIAMKRAGLRVVVLFTEAPYDLEQELKIAALVDGCWTNERSALSAFRAVNQNAGYLPAGWHPTRHVVTTAVDPDVPAHDVVFVGSGFPSRIDWLEAMDWTGIDLGLYGTWDSLTKRSPLRKFWREGAIENTHAIALYRRAKIVLNFYRGSVVVAPDRVLEAPGESLNPRAYELAACGVFSISEARAESQEVFGDRVPLFRTPLEASALMHAWLGRDAERRQIVADLPAMVAESSWSARALTVIGDIQSLLQRRAA